MKKPAHGAPDKRLIQSLKKASELLDLFVESKKSLGISDFSRRLHRPKTTIQGIVNTLTALQYLEKDQQTAKYRLGPKLFQLGMKYATNMDLATIARVWMERLCYQFREPVNVGMLVGGKVVIVMRIEPDNTFMVFPQVGSVIPSHTTSIGKILFAFLDSDSRQKLLDGYAFDRLTANSIDNAKDFSAELLDVKNKGIAFDREENIIGLAGIGAPIFNYNGDIIAAFAVTGNVKNIEARRGEIVESVLYTSTAVSHQLGYVPAGNSS